MKVTGTDLVAWADRLDCRSSLPELVRRLIHCTVEPSKLEAIDFPSGEGVQKHGVDGRVRVSEGNEYLPLGSSVWEMGCSRDPEKKADEDYAARKKDPGDGIDPATTTFVFVTPRRWYGRETWAAERRKEGLWADVRVHDADSLEQWLDLAPAARAWLCPIVGKPYDAQELAVCWTEWSLRTDPPMSLALVRAGREEPWASFSSWLASPPEVLAVKVDDPSEAAAYLYASAVLLGPKPKQALLDRTLVVASGEVLRRLMLEGRSLVIVALDCPIELSRLAAKRGHHVLHATTAAGMRQAITLSRDDAGRTNDSLDLIVAALQQMHIPATRAQHLAKESGGSLARLHELLRDAPEVDTSLAPLVMVAAWNDASESDVALVSEISGLDATTVRELVRRASVGPSPDFIRVKDALRWGSQLAAWRALARALGPEDIKRFRTAVTRVFGSPDPRYELEPDKRFAANVYGKVPPNSADLRRGLIDTVVLLATSADALEQHINGQREADHIVALIMRGLTGWEHWATLDRFLPLLAEAAPDTFLRELRSHVEERPELMARVMTVDPNAIWGGGHSVGLVWALETLAWNPTYLPAASELLAKLARLDPGGNYHPRPIDGLVEVFIPWRPQTAATLDQRIGALSAVARSEPELFVRLALELRRKETSSPTHKPTVRPWMDGWIEGVTRDEIDATHERLWELVLVTCDANPQLWAMLVPETRWLTSRARTEAFDRLRTFDPSVLQQSAQNDLGKGLRDALNFALTHPDSINSPAPEQLEVLQSLLAKLRPTDVRDKHRWLFARNAHLPDVSSLDFEGHQKALTERCEAAARELVEQLTPDELWAFAASVEDPRNVGISIARTPEHEVLAYTLVRRTLGLERSAWADELRSGLLGPLYWRDPQAFLALLRDADAAPLKGLSTADRIEIAHVLKPTKALWEVVGSLGPEAARQYWQRMDPLFVEDQDQDEVLDRLVAAGRPLKAVETAGMWSHRRALSPAQLAAVLRAAATSTSTEERRTRGPMSYHVAALLKRLAASEEVSREELFGLEFMWLPLVEHEYRPTILFEELARNPSSWVELMSRVFRGKDEVRDPEDEKAVLNARHAWRVLEAWHGLPGLQADGTVDRAHLLAWVQRARDLLRERGRKAIGDERVGAVLAHAPTGTDGHWPHEVVRDVIESLNDVSDIQSGFINGRYNQRGVVTKQFGDGGAQELSLAETYESSAAALRTRWPRTAGFLDALGRQYRAEARGEDMDTAKMAASMRPEANPEDRARVFADNLQSRGRYTFSFAELAAGTSLHPGDARRAADALVRDHRLASPAPGFFVVVPPGHRSAEAPPPTWYLDDWMRYAKTDYYVGLLSAAALHGAASQQPLAYQVIVGAARDSATVGRSRIDFFADDRVGESLGVEVKKTDVGFIRVSSPERTLLDLVKHADAIGGIDLVASVIEELGEECDDGKLGTVATLYPDAVIQRAGWILEHTGHAARATALRALVLASKPSPVTLRAVPANGKEPEAPWNVIVDAPLEPAA